MNPKIKEKWIEALRSGEYKQGQEALLNVYEDTKEYCCLGVLCELYAIEYPDKAEFRYSGVFYTDMDILGHEQNHDNYLPEVVREWAGIDDENPQLFDGGPFLSEINDGSSAIYQGDHDFNTIADLIDKRF